MADARPLPIRSEPLRPLAGLAMVQGGAAAYYGALRHAADPIVAAGAWCALLDGWLLRPAMWDEVLPWCRYAAVRRRAFGYFEGVFEHDRAAQALATDAPTAGEAEQAMMRATLAFDAAAAANAAGALYLATGDIAHLQRASEQADLAGGWRPALQWAVRAVAIAPLTPQPLQRLYLVLDGAGQGAMMKELAELLGSQNLHLAVAQVFAASSALKRGDAKETLAKLSSFDDKRILEDKGLSPWFGQIRSLQAAAEERFGNYETAYRRYLALNAAEKPANVDPENFFRGITARAKLPVPVMPAREREDVFQMLGFPRSGTTFLENALDAHPEIETFEEIPALNAAIHRIERDLSGKPLGLDDPAATFLSARARYYDEVDRRRRKTGARILIDKLPIRSADVAFISRLFPEWRYVFTVRHPFDVVLSCFKQRFVPNPINENFRSLEAAIRVYDFTMTQWFSHFSLSDARVAYVCYDLLLTDFRSQMERILTFVGLEWADSISDFATAAERRPANTPSYEKVRRGLSLGVQTQWRNYGFLFQSDTAAPLKKWAEFFGYPTQ